MSATLVIPEHHIGLTAEELQKRARVRELRDLIRKEARDRTVIKTAYRLPHRSPEHKAAMAAVRAHLGIDPKITFEWNWHCQPNRDYGRAWITELHIELATLRGKVHGPRPLS